VLASNRDEYLDRDTKRTDWWDVPYTHVLGPRDVQAGVNGTWIGITKQGRWATLTNYHEINGMNASNKTSRGILVRDYLVHDVSPQQYLQSLCKTASPALGVTGQSLADTMATAPTTPPLDASPVAGASPGSPPESINANAATAGADLDIDDFNGFSLVVGDIVTGQVLATSNRGDHGRGVRTLPADDPAVHGLSNQDLDANWPRVQRGSLILSEIVSTWEQDHFNSPHGSEGAELALIEQLFAMLRDTSPFTQSGGPRCREDLRKPICLPVVEYNDRLYGTACSTVILVDRFNRVWYHERQLVTPDGLPHTEGGRVFEFVVDPELDTLP
ncbi:hypothetical protein H4R35_003358, partial [Dimargaris xerosporica]